MTRKIRFRSLDPVQLHSRRVASLSAPALGNEQICQDVCVLAFLSFPQASEPGERTATITLSTDDDVQQEELKISYVLDEEGA